MTRMTQKRLGKFQGPINDSYTFQGLTTALCGYVYVPQKGR